MEPSDSPKCTTCGAETLLRRAEVPYCPECVDQIESPVASGLLREEHHESTVDEGDVAGGRVEPNAS